MATVYFEDLEIGSVHVGRECACDHDEMLEYGRRNDLAVPRYGMLPIHSGHRERAHNLCQEIER